MQLFSDHAWWRNTWQSVKEHIQLLWRLPPEVRKSKTSCNFLRIVEPCTASSHRLFETVLQTPHSCWVRSNLICGETNKAQTKSCWKKFCLVNISSETSGCFDVTLTSSLVFWMATMQVCYATVPEERGAWCSSALTMGKNYASHTQVSEILSACVLNML